LEVAGALEALAQLAPDAGIGEVAGHRELALAAAAEPFLANTDANLTTYLQTTGS